MFDTLLKEVKRLADYELTDSREKHEPKFHSIHEGYGVLAEEVDEAKEEAECVNRRFDCLLPELRNEYAYAIPNLVELKERALNAAAEYIQVAAMSQKMLEIVEDDKHG